VKKHILITDDEPLILLGLAEALQSESIHIDTATTATKAVEMIAGSQYDLYILDLTLPDMNGFELAQKIRDCHPKAKFIFMSGKYRDLQDMLQNSAKAAALNPTAFITKPFDFAQAHDIVCRSLVS